MSEPHLHSNYLRVRDAALASHASLRSLEPISDEIILLARLYCYSFRGGVIGVFHATARALEGAGIPDQALLERTLENLRALAALSVETVPTDYRAVLGNFHRYDRGIVSVLKQLDALAAREKSAGAIRGHFVAAIGRVTGSSGIAITRDDAIPEQASFIVPALGITIVPLVYGDQHSWNMAFLSGENLNVPRHMHREGIEIHLGRGKLHGFTCLGGSKAEVREGYAMPIPPGTPHGYVNLVKNHDHQLPFIFGSRRLGGWGIIPDVNPQPIDPAELKAVDLADKSMNGSVPIDQEIAGMIKEKGTMRRMLLPAEPTFSPTAGGLAFSIVRIEGAPVTYDAERFQTISVVHGRGDVTIGPAKAELAAHAHFGVPTGARVTIEATEPLILLEATLVEELI